MTLGEISLHSCLIRYLGHSIFAGLVDKNCISGTFMKTSSMMWSLITWLTILRSIVYPSIFRKFSGKSSKMERRTILLKSIVSVRNINNSESIPPAWISNNSLLLSRNVCSKLYHQQSLRTHWLFWMYFTVTIPRTVSISSTQQHQFCHLTAIFNINVNLYENSVDSAHCSLVDA